MKTILAPFIHKIMRFFLIGAEFKTLEIETLPERMVECFLRDETPLFKLKTIAHKTASRIFRGIYVGIPIFIVSFLVTAFLLGTGNISDNVIIGIFCPFAVGTVVFIYAYLFNIPKTLVFCITNKKVYMQTTEDREKVVHFADLKTIKAIILNKGKFSKKYGSFKFITDDKIFGMDNVTGTGYVQIQNLPKMLETQRIIESILYEYGNIVKRWENVREKMLSDFPFNFKVSQGELNKISKRIKWIILFVGIFYMISTVLIVFVVNNIALIYNADILLILVVFGICLFIVLAIAFSWDISLELKRRSPKNASLILETDQIILKGDGPLVKLPLSNDMTLKELNIKGALDWRKWESDLEGIVVKPSYIAKEKINFGPFEKFTDAFELFFCYLLMWKKQNGYLLSKEQISNIDSLFKIDSD